MGFFCNQVNAQGCAGWQYVPRTPVPFVIDSSGSTPVAPDYRCDDGVSGPIVLPFHFCFWGRIIDTVYINNNGNVSFVQPYSGFVPVTFPLTNYSMVAPFWADVDTRNSTSLTPSGVVSYQLTAHHLLVEWDSIGYYFQHTDKRNTFQCILTDGNDPIIPFGNDVQFSYKTMQWTTGDASGGVNGFGGSPATVGANKGDGIQSIQIGLFDSAGNLYQGQYPPAPRYDQVWWLDGQTFYFDACANQAPPLYSGVSACDTFKVCIGDTTNVRIKFFSPKPGLITNCVLMPVVPPGVSITQNHPGNTDSLVLQLIGTNFNVGYNNVILGGYDNTVPQDTTFIHIIFKVDSNATGSIHASKDTICAGDSLWLREVSPNATSFIWSNNSTADSIKVKPVVTTTYTLTLFRGTCSFEITKTITVLTRPSLTITKDSICPYDSTTLTVTNGTTFAWSNGATTSSITIKLDSSTTFRVITSNPCTGIDTLKKRAYLMPEPAVTFSLNDSICPGSPITITATGGTKYLWSNGATTSSINVSPIVNTTYSLTVKNATCQKDTTFTVYMKPPPIVTLGGVTAVCPGNPTTLTASGGLTYQWSTGSTNTSITVSPLTTTTYTVKVFKGTCEKDTTITVNMLPLPAVTFTGNQVLCIGDSTTITAAGGTGYVWNIGPVVDSIRVGPVSTTTYSLQVTGANGCIKDTTVRVIVNHYPNITIGGDTSICPGDSALIVASGGFTFHWSTGSTYNSTYVKPIVNTTYTVQVSDFGCTRDSTITVKLKPIPLAAINPPNQSICPGVTTSLVASGGIIYGWNTGDTIDSISVTPLATTMYIVSVSTGGCKAYDTGYVTVLPLPAGTTAGATTIINGQSTTISVTSSIPGTYSWSPSISLSCDTCPNPIASPTNTTTYTVIITDSSGCRTIDTIVIKVKPKCGPIYLPNAFSPNGDGINDMLYVMGNCIKEMNLVIYDRWGNTVFESSDPIIGWDGTFKGQPMNTGTYVYTLRTVDEDNNTVVTKGNITLVR